MTNWDKIICWQNYILNRQTCDSWHNSNWIKKIFLSLFIHHQTDFFSETKSHEVHQKKRDFGSLNLKCWLVPLKTSVWLHSLFSEIRCSDSFFEPRSQLIDTAAMSVGSLMSWEWDFHEIFREWSGKELAETLKLYVCLDFLICTICCCSERFTNPKCDY